MSEKGWRLPLAELAKWRLVATGLISTLLQPLLARLAAQSRSLVMAFLMRPRIFHDQPARGPLASCGLSADAFTVIAPAAAP